MLDSPAIRASSWLNLLSIDNALASALRERLEISAFDLTNKDILHVILMASESRYYKTAADTHPKYASFAVDELLPHKCVWFQAQPCGLELYLLDVDGAVLPIVGLEFHWRHFLSEIMFMGIGAPDSSGGYRLAIPVPDEHVLHAIVRSGKLGGYDYGGVTQMGVVTKYALADGSNFVRGIEVKTGPFGRAKTTELTGPGGFRFKLRLSKQEFDAWDNALRTYHKNESPSSHAELARLAGAAGAKKVAAYKLARSTFRDMMRSDRSTVIDTASVPLAILSGEAFIQQMEKKITNQKYILDLKDVGLGATLAYCEFGGAAIWMALLQAMRDNRASFPKLQGVLNSTPSLSMLTDVVKACAKLEPRDQRSIAVTIASLVAKKSVFSHLRQTGDGYVWSEKVTKTPKWCVGAYGLEPLAANGDFHAIERIKTYASGTFESKKRNSSAIECYLALREAKTTQLY